MLWACLRDSSSKWFLKCVSLHAAVLRKCRIAREAGHGSPDSGRSRSEPPIIVVMGKAWRLWPSHGCALLLLGCMVLTGCAGVSSGGQSANSNPNPSPAPSPSPSDPSQLSVAPTSINFGSVAVGSQATQAGTLTAGAADINVTSAAWSGQGYNVSGITFPVTVAAGKSVNYSVTFTPQSAGDIAGSISFVNDGSTSPVTQTLDGDGGQAGVHTVGLSWDASASAVIGYNVYRGTQSGGPYQRLTSSPQAGTNYTDSTVLTGTTYYYVATAVDSSHVESVYSNQAQAVVP
jgi:hypothetical protein